MSNIFVSSDPHAFHRNIAGPKVSAWKEGYRDFNDEHEMTAHIVKVWNRIVKEDDTLYCLGDWAFGGLQNIWNFRKQLRCNNIHLILGNHDHHIETNKPLNLPADTLEQTLRFEMAPNHITTRDLFSSVQHVLTTKLEGRAFFMSHYAHRVWGGSHKGICHLYGHSHGSIADCGKSMDVGIDVAKRLVGDYCPFSLGEIDYYMDCKEIAFPDHHNINTNIK